MKSIFDLEEVKESVWVTTAVTLWVASSWFLADGVYLD